eukprot:comp18089_c1_seq1/m.18711 comp18089_c1_seq1/g.18711  ORF comp18089_c1_seq1/g.18711 comp18089_c1_seq1/m.18711 type:complete len:345 (-) comp18089_c1_seq1:37-1071(-)
MKGSLKKRLSQSLITSLLPSSSKGGSLHLHSSSSSAIAIEAECPTILPDPPRIIPQTMPPTQWLLFFGDSSAGVNSMLQYYSRQTTLRDLIQHQPLYFMQTKRITVAVGKDRHDVLCSSHAFMDQCEDRLARQAIYDQAYAASLLVVVFDIKNRETFVNATTYVTELHELYPDVPKLLLGLGAQARSTMDNCVTTRQVSMAVDGFNLEGYYEAHGLESGRPFHMVDVVLERAVAASVHHQQRRMGQDSIQSDLSPFPSRNRMSVMRDGDGTDCDSAIEDNGGGILSGMRRPSCKSNSSQLSVEERPGSTSSSLNVTPLQSPTATATKKTKRRFNTFGRRRPDDE